MCQRLLLRLTVCLLPTLLLTLSASAQQAAQPAPFDFKPGQTVYIVAVRHRAPMSRDYWLEVNQDLPKGRVMQGGPPDPRTPDPNGRATLERAPNERATLDGADGRATLDGPQAVLSFSEPPDEAVKLQASELLQRQKKFKVVDTPAQADFVLLLQGEYAAHFQQHSPRGSIVIMGMGADRSEESAATQLVKLNAVAIPATLFRQAQRFLPDNAETVRWRGRAVGRMRERANFEAPSIENLLKQFQKEVLK